MVLFPAESAQSFIFADHDDSGGATVAWLDEKHTSWRCEIPDDGGGRDCGITLSLVSPGVSGIDLSGYDAVNIDLDYSGPGSRLRFYIRNYRTRLFRSEQYHVGEVH